MDIEFINDFDSINWADVKLVVDAIFGFSFKPPVRTEFMAILKKLSSLNSDQHTLVSVDIPSGWHVENGPPTDNNNDNTPILKPDCLISLTAAKQCAKHFVGQHWLCGRFIPLPVRQKYNITFPTYPDTEHCYLLK